jgi:D-tyrosyl-tRNA(Tyr) deacylase
MRVVLQRVSEATVTVDGETIAAVGRGLVLLVGLAAGDGEAEVAWMAQKIANLRVFADAEGLMNAALGYVGGQVLAIPQFTLLGDCRKGRRPSFEHAMAPAHAEPWFERFIALLAARTGHVAIGRFGASMQVRLVNDGPVTFVIERSKPRAAS